MTDEQIKAEFDAIMLLMPTMDDQQTLTELRDSILARLQPSATEQEPYRVGGCDAALSTDAQPSADVEQRAKAAWRDVCKANFASQEWLLSTRVQDEIIAIIARHFTPPTLPPDDQAGV